MLHAFPEIQPGLKVSHSELGDGVVVGREPTGYITVFFRAHGERQVPPDSLRLAADQSNWIVEARIGPIDIPAIFVGVVAIRQEQTQCSRPVGCEAAVTEICREYRGRCRITCVDEEVAGLFQKGNLGWLLVGICVGECQSEEQIFPQRVVRIVDAFVKGPLGVEVCTLVLQGVAAVVEPFEK